MNPKIVVLLVLGIALLPFTAAVTDVIGFRNYDVEYSYDQDDVVAGESFRLHVTITNTDDTNHTDIELTIDEDNPFRLGDDDFDIDELEPGESRSKSFRIDVDDDTPEDDYELDFTLEDDDDDYDDVFDIEVQSITPDLIIADIEILPDTLLPDLEDVELTLFIENIGEGDARFIRAEVELPDGFRPSSSFADETNLGTLVRGDRKEATFFIDTDPDVEEGLYTGRLRLVYEDEENDGHTKILEFDLPVRGKPLFSITDVMLQPNPLMPGADGVITITIRNVGTETAEETSLRVFENSDLPIEFEEKTNFIGTIEPGETGTATFTFEVDNDASAKPYILKLQTRTINENDVIVDDKTVKIEIVEKQNGANGAAIGLVVGIVVVLGLLAWAVVYLFKSRKSI